MSFATDNTIKTKSEATGVLTMTIKEFDELIDNTSNSEICGYINNMDRKELLNIKGIGPKLAGEIGLTIWAHGGFSDHTDLLTLVDGIGRRLYLRVLKRALKQISLLKGGI